jgi:hypothetical protein
MSQAAMHREFKEFRVLVADNAQQIGFSVTAMLLLGEGWQIYGPVQCVVKGDGLEYYQAIMRYEIVSTPAQETETPKEH